MKTLKEAAKDSMEEAAKHFDTKGGALAMFEGMTSSMNKTMRERIAYLKSLSPKDQRTAMKEGREMMTKEDYLALPHRDQGQKPGVTYRMFTEDKVKEVLA